MKMRNMNKLNYASSIALVFSFCFLTSCNRTHKEQEDDKSVEMVSVYAEYPDEYDLEIKHTALRYCDFDSIGNLRVFFDSIEKEHDIPIRESMRDDGDSELLSDCIQCIERYRQGSAKFYPDSLVRLCIDVLGCECAIFANHSSPLDMSYAEWFFMCAAYYAPDISYLVDMQSPDHRTGIMNLGQSYNDAPWWAYFVCKRQKGYEIKFLGEETKINSLFQLEDEHKRRYYLCSNNDLNLQVLYFAKDDDGMIEVAKTRQMPKAKNVCFDTYYFNAKELSWYFCKWDRDKQQRIKVCEQPCMKLNLRGEETEFQSVFLPDAE